MFDKDLMTSKTKLEQIIDRLKEIVDDVVPRNMTHYNGHYTEIKHDIIADVIRDQNHNGDLLRPVMWVEVDVSYKKRIPVYCVKFEVEMGYNITMQASIKGVIDIKTYISNGTIR